MRTVVATRVGKNRAKSAGPLTRSSVQAAIKNVCDILRRSNCAGALQYVPEISWLLFLRILDERDERAELEARQRGTTHKPAVEPPYRWRDWASPPNASIFEADVRHFQGWKRAQLQRRGQGELFAFLCDDLMPYLHSLGSRAGAEPIASVISAVVRSISRPKLDCEADFLAVLDRLDGIRESQIDKTHVFPLSEIYEGLLLKMGEKAADGGQFFTPREVIRAMVRIVDPRLGETVYDPCCGTGGFLAEAFEHIRRQGNDEGDSLPSRVRGFFGREKDNAIYPITLANLLLHGIDVPNVCNGNTLTGAMADESLFQDAPATFDVVLTNPPFGGKEGKEAQDRFAYPTSSTQVLFLQHVIDSLKPGGRCGIVVDEGVLFRTADTAFVQTKRKLLSECDLWCVVSLPPGTFASAGAGVKTNLLFFTKGQPTKTVWYYDLSWRPVGKKTPLCLNDFDELLQLLPGRDDSSHSWSRSRQEIEDACYDLKATNPHSSFTSEEFTLAELLKEVRDCVQDIEKYVAALENSIHSKTASRNEVP